MEIGVIGTVEQWEEVKAKFGNDYTYAFADPGHASDLSRNVSTVFVFDPGKSYSLNLDVPVFLEASQMSLSNRLKDRNNIPRHVFGFCGLPTFFNRPLLEVSLHHNSDARSFKEIASTLKTDYQIVDDRCGMVTPRVICMIINEAYYTCEEGTATRADIDLAMKLGTNYPWGPFEWCQRIGITHVVALLDAVHADTGDERYQVCELLRKESL